MKMKKIKGVPFKVDVSKSDFSTSIITLDGGPDLFCQIKCIGTPRIWTYRALLEKVYELIDKKYEKA